MKASNLFLLTCALFGMILNHSFAQNIDPESEVPANCWRWEKMRPADLKKALETVPVAYLVISPLEWHGEAMTFGTDPVIGTEIAELAWRKTGGVIIPTLYLGSETEFKEFIPGVAINPHSFWGLEVRTREVNPGSIYVSNYLVELVLRDMLWFIEREGFKACVIVSGHGATEYSRIIGGIEKQYENRPMRVFYSNLAPMEPPADTGFRGSGGHADFAEASVLGAVDPSQVDKNLFGISERDRKIEILHENVDKIDYEKGRARINYRAERIARTVDRFLNEE
jgi:creatinine amidohydrolase